MAHKTNELEELLARQASRWVEVMQGPTPEDRAAFVVWLKESPRNVRDFMFMLTVEQGLKTLDSARRHDIDSMLAQLDAQVVELPTPLARSRRSVASEPNRPRRLLATAASVAVISIIGWMLESHYFGWKVFETATGEQRAFELVDGSVVHLNAHSRVAIRLSEHARDVRLLEGEALFVVHHDEARPFRVYTIDAMIQAVGTQFDVYARRDETTVAVIEGRVNVSAQPAALKANSPTSVADPQVAPTAVTPLLLSSHEEARITHAGHLSVRADAEVSDAVAWRERRLIFRQQSLQNIVDEFNRYSHKPIRLEGAAVGNRVYSGIFDAGDVDSLAQVLARDSELVIDKSDQVIIVRAR